MKDNWWLEVDKFNKSGLNEQIVTFKLPKKDRKLLKDFPEWYDKEVECRLIKVELASGENEILCTSLADMEKYLYDDFIQLYHFRWNEEEAYKLLKCRVEVENFSEKTTTAVKQDFYAKIFLLTLCAAYAHPMDEKVREEYKANENRKYDQKINRTNAIAMTQVILITMSTFSLIFQHLSSYKLIDYNHSKRSGIDLLIIVLLFMLHWRIIWLIWIGNFAYSICMFHVFGTAGRPIHFKAKRIQKEAVIFIISLFAGILVPFFAEVVFDRLELTSMLLT